MSDPKEKKALKRAVAQAIEGCCRQVTHLCLEHAEEATDLVRSGQIRGQGKNAASRLGKALGDRSNISQSAFLILAGAAAGYDDACQKLADVQEFFRKQPDSWIEYLVFGRSPYAENCLARYWTVKRTYVRNFLVGIRRQLNPHLPESLQEGARLPAISANAWGDACHARGVEIAQTTHKRQAEGLSVDRLKTFQGKLTKLATTPEEVVAVLNQADLTLGWKPTKQVAHMLGTLLPGRTKRYHSAVRSVLSLAVMASAPTLTVTLQSQGVDLLTPDHCLSRPFSHARTQSSSSQPSRLQPVELVMGAKYVIKRPGNAQVLTALLRELGYFSLLILGPPKKPGSRATPPMEVHVRATHKMRTILARDSVQIKCLRVLPPRGPSRKVCVDIIFEGPEEAFAAMAHLIGPQLLALTPSPSPSPPCFPGYVGLDLNRLGPYILAFSPSTSLTPTLQQICDHYLNLRDTIATLNRALARAEARQHLRQCTHIRRELSLVHRKRSQLRKEAHAHCSVDIGLHLCFLQAHTLVGEDLALDASGTRGGLARAIYTMPDDSTIIHRAIRNVNALHPVVPVVFLAIDPRGTSRVHAGCGGQLHRQPGQYDWVVCSTCGEPVNTHTNSGKVLLYKFHQIDYSLVL